MANILYENGFPIKAIVNGKLVDVAEVRHGRWKPFDLTCGRSVYACTSCGEALEVPTDCVCRKPMYEFCPYCGAKMDEEDQPKHFWPEQVEKIIIEAIAKAVTHKDTEEDPDDKTL